MTRASAAAPSESSIQIKLVKILEYAGREDVFVYAVPNAGRRSFATAMRMKAEGMKAGVSDLCFLFPVDEPGGCTAYLELKTIGGSLSIAQRGFAAICRRFGIRWATAKTLDEAIDVMREWNVLRPNAEVM